MIKRKEFVREFTYLKNKNRLVGLAEMFDYKKKLNQMTIGYRLNEAYWHRGIATEATRLMVHYLCSDMGIKTLKAYVMPENIYSQKALTNNGFVREPNMVKGEKWDGTKINDLYVFTYTV